jgi:hypothetical protein
MRQVGQEMPDCHEVVPVCWVEARWPDDTHLAGEADRRLTFRKRRKTKRNRSRRRRLGFPRYFPASEHSWGDEAHYHGVYLELE